VLLFLLAAISIRALDTLWRRNRLRAPFRKPHAVPAADEPPTSTNGSGPGGLPRAGGRGGRARQHTGKWVRRAAERTTPAREKDGWRRVQLKISEACRTVRSGQAVGSAYSHV